MLKGKNLVIAILLVLVCVLGVSNIENSKDISALSNKIEFYQAARKRAEIGENKTKKRAIKAENEAQAYAEQLNDSENENKVNRDVIEKLQAEKQGKTEVRDSINTKTGKHEKIYLTPAQAKEFDTVGEIPSDELN